jgi:DNA-binding NtrC family response regulator
LGEKITLDDVKRVLHQFDDPKETIKTTEVKKNKLIQVEEMNSDSLEHMPFLDQPLREARDAFERIYFQHHMKDAINNMSKLADIAGLERTHLYRKLKQLGIKIK